MAGCYWGWGTRGNRIAWILVVAFVLIGAAFWIPGVVEIKKCINKHNRCACEATPGGTWVCLDARVPAEKERLLRCYEQYARCVRTPAAVWGVGWLFLVLLSWIPCCYFCCCSKNPKTAGAAGNVGYPAGLQMSPMTSPQPYATTYPAYNTPTGFPQGPVPGTAAYPAAAPATAYPAGQQAGPPYTQQAGPYESNVPVHRY